MAKNKRYLFYSETHWRVKALWFMMVISPYANLIHNKDKRLNFTELSVLCLCLFILTMIAWRISDRVFISKTNRVKVAAILGMSNATNLLFYVPIVLTVFGLILNVLLV